MFIKDNGVCGRTHHGPRESADGIQRCGHFNWREGIAADKDCPSGGFECCEPRGQRDRHRRRQGHFASGECPGNGVLEQLAFIGKIPA